LVLSDKTKNLSRQGNKLNKDLFELDSTKEIKDIIEIKKNKDKFAKEYPFGLNYSD
jgi:hypothetical protein